jgi:hypothetical protein
LHSSEYIKAHVKRKQAGEKAVSGCGFASVIFTGNIGEYDWRKLEIGTLPAKLPSSRSALRRKFGTRRLEAESRFLRDKAAELRQ